LSNVQSNNLQIAVVGHTNTGKTSLIRTLLRSSQFGKIDDRAGTTRHVERASINIAHDISVAFFDTPGLEDIEGLNIALRKLDSEALSETDKRALSESVIESNGRPRDKLETLIPILSGGPLEQECKSLRQVLKSDLLLYVIDTREPLLDKYLNELDIIAMAGQPIIPVLNFIQQDNSRLTEWQRALADRGLHATVEYDTVAFNFGAEEKLYRKCQSLLGKHHDTFQILIELRANAWHELLNNAQLTAAEWMVNACAWRLKYRGTTHATVVSDRLKEQLRSAEHNVLLSQLQAFGFAEDDLHTEAAKVKAGAWQLDLFDKQGLGELGKEIGSTATKGAALGAGIDLMVGGLSLGAASLIGGTLGASWSLLQRFGGELSSLISGEKYICLDNEGARLLFLRQAELLKILAHRGHASQQAVVLSGPAIQAESKDWQRWLTYTRQHPQWSCFSHACDTDNEKRAYSVDTLAILFKNTA
jgi:hypothetical protein